MIKAKVMSFVAAKNPAAAREFYEKALGLKFVSEDPFAVVFDMEGTMLRMQKVRELLPAQYTVLGWAVEDIRAEAGALAKRGVKFERFAGLEQDDRGV